MEHNIQKQVYSAPEIDSIALDNDISLQLASNPPWGPGEAALGALELTNTNSFEIF